MIRGELGDKQGAITDYSQAIKINSNDLYAYYNRGITRSDLGNKQGAISDFKVVEELSRKQGNMEFYQLALKLIKKYQ
jgi:tetratricopeptide (TPR) repeat protein